MTVEAQRFTRPDSAGLALKAIGPDEPLTRENFAPTNPEDWHMEPDGTWWRKAESLGIRR